MGDQFGPGVIEHERVTQTVGTVHGVGERGRAGEAYGRPAHAAAVAAVYRVAVEALPGVRDDRVEEAEAFVEGTHLEGTGTFAVAEDHGSRLGPSREVLQYCVLFDGAE